MKRKQQGMTLVSFVVVLAAVGFVLYLGMKLFPMYQEYYAVRTAMKSVANEPGSAGLDPSQLQDMLFKRLDISYSDSVKPENVSFERGDRGLKMHVAYEVRRPLVGNLDVVGKFEATQDLTRQDGGEQ